MELMEEGGKNPGRSAAVSASKPVSSALPGKLGERIMKSQRRKELVDE
ncbi:hypothetical protein [Paenibacillus sp.]|jgi:hypothetical protein|nr:hypothetical protein [Paenibacillus sp.]MDR0268879.1 hypothetical protein [Paenibacillus sp.]